MDEEYRGVIDLWLNSLIEERTKELRATITAQAEVIERLREVLEPFLFPTIDIISYDKRTLIRPEILITHVVKAREVYDWHST